MCGRIHVFCGEYGSYELCSSCLLAKWYACSCLIGFNCSLYLGWSMLVWKDWFVTGLVHACVEGLICNWVGPCLWKDWSSSRFQHQHSRCKRTRYVNCVGMLFGLLYPITSTTCKFCCFDICATVTPPPPIPSPTTFLCLSTFYPSLPSHSKSKGGEFSIFSTQHGLIMVRACEGVTKLTSLHNYPNFFSTIYFILHQLFLNQQPVPTTQSLFPLRCTGQNRWLHEFYASGSKRKKRLGWASHRSLQVNAQRQVVQCLLNSKYVRRYVA